MCTADLLPNDVIEGERREVGVQAAERCDAVSMSGKVCPTRYAREAQLQIIVRSSVLRAMSRQPRSQSLSQPRRCEALVDLSSVYPVAGLDDEVRIVLLFGASGAAAYP